MGNATDTVAGDGHRHVTGDGGAGVLAHVIRTAHERAAGADDRRGLKTHLSSGSSPGIQPRISGTESKRLTPMPRLASAIALCRLPPARRSQPELRLGPTQRFARPAQGRTKHGSFELPNRGHSSFIVTTSVTPYLKVTAIHKVATLLIPIQLFVSGPPGTLSCLAHATRDVTCCWPFVRWPAATFAGRLGGGGLRGSAASGGAAELWRWSRSAVIGDSFTKPQQVATTRC